ncbi:MAG TPA: formate dehydrogenase accessory sulfurtransferase FdhD [Polyangiaceae bacterium]|jgi:FdhD protein|nr:formate dehydrogenase accessory sulfurtransferase FdhD [Polyangiaceae bacterium]
MTRTRQSDGKRIRVPVVRYESGAPSTRADSVAVEEPLEIRVAGETLALTMRTPGEDHELAVGFLFSEGILLGRDGLGFVVHCGRPGEDGFGNVIDVTAAPGTAFDVERTGLARRGTITTAACGVCGRASIDDLVARIGTVSPGARFSARNLSQWVRALRDRQPLFAETGGVHAAALTSNDGNVVATREDVGRHNAVDKVVGRAVLDGRVPLDGHALVVSGRTSFEIVAKAAAAGVSLVAGVSAPSSLAIEVATRSGLTLVGFARDEAFTVYANPERIVD